jgi:hypothetical protein
MKNILKHTLLVLFLVCTYLVQGQNTFQKTYQGFGATAIHAIQVGDFYYLSVNEISTGDVRSNILKIGLDGNLVQEIKPAIVDSCSGEYGVNLYENDGDIQHLLSSSCRYSRGYIKRVSTLGNTRFVKTTIPAFNEVGHSTLETTYDESGIYISGSHFGPDAISGLVNKIDHNGEFLWHKKIPSTGSLNDPLWAIDNNGEHLIAVGHTFDAVDGDRDGIIASLTKDGEMKWYKTYDDTTFGKDHADFNTSDETYESVRIFDDGTFVTGLNVGNFPELILAHGYLNLHDINGEFIWKREFFDSLRSVYIDDIKINQSNKNIVVLYSTRKNQDAYFQTYLVKINYEGELLWKQDYSFNETSNNYARSLELLDDGSFLIGGWVSVYDENDDFLYQAPRLIKTDACGCFEPGCNPDCNKFPASISPTNNGNTITLFPNPTNGEVSIYFSKAISRLQLKVVNALGQLVYSESTEVFNNKLSRNWSELPKGVYNLSIVTDSEERMNKMFVVE